MDFKVDNRLKRQLIKSQVKLCNSKSCSTFYFLVYSFYTFIVVLISLASVGLALFAFLTEGYFSGSLTILLVGGCFIFGAWLFRFVLRMPLLDEYAISALRYSHERIECTDKKLKICRRDKMESNYYVVTSIKYGAVNKIVYNEDKGVLTVQGYLREVDYTDLGMQRHRNTYNGEGCIEINSYFRDFDKLRALLVSKTNLSLAVDVCSEEEYYVKSIL